MTIQKFVNYEMSVGANGQTFIAQATQDDNVNRTVTGIWSNDATKLVQTAIQLQGKNIVAYDDYFNSLLKEPLACNVVFPAGVQITLGLINGTAGAINNVDILVRYEIPG